jgi:hypothetical protein
MMAGPVNGLQLAGVGLNLSLQYLVLLSFSLQTEQCEYKEKKRWKICNITVAVV